MFPILLSLALRSVLEVSHVLPLAPVTSSCIILFLLKQFLNHQPCAVISEASGPYPLQRDWGTWLPWSGAWLETGSVAGGRLLGRKKLWASGKKIHNLLSWAHLQGHPETCPKEAVSTKGLSHRVFWFGRCFCFFILLLIQCRFYILVTCCHSLSIFKGQNGEIHK